VKKRVPAVAAESHLAALRQARRILVLGSPGAGKTVLSSFLSRHLGVELLRLDDYFWKPGAVRVPTDEWRTIVAQLANRPAWVMDGTYEASLDLRLPAAEAIVYIRSDRWTCLARVVTRRLLRRWRRVDESTHGHALTSFFLRYVLRFPVSTQPEVFRLIARHGHGKPLIVLDGRRGVDLLIRRLDHGRPGAGASSEDGAPAQGPRGERQRSRHA
jgi:adenylate kinase family enzyme